MVTLLRLAVVLWYFVNPIPQTPGEKPFKDLAVQVRQVPTGRLPFGINPGERVTTQDLLPGQVTRLGPGVAGKP